MNKFKVTNGFVIQEYDKSNKCTGQEFIAGDECVWENKDGEVIDEPTIAEYFPYNMAQPNSIESLDQGDIVTILELARVAVSDAEVYEYIADKLDLSDDYMKELQDTLFRLTEEGVS